MSPPGRPKDECRRAQHEGSSIPPPGRPKDEYQRAPHAGEPPSARSAPAPPAHWDSTTLLQGATRTFITHRGETYCLQLTRQGKLILTK